ncbi:MAG: hypothetical protein SPJ57_00365 [Candidatus Methanomethylophilaceae archaeon]|nr:hypothetical protein [Candidatus Methanomethylophilaceae archaeon]
MDENTKEWVLREDSFPDVDGICFMSFDWIMEPLYQETFYDFDWWLNVAKSHVRPGVKKYGVPRELYMAAIRNVLVSDRTGEYLDFLMKRMKCIVRKAMRRSYDTGLERPHLKSDDVTFPNDLERRYCRQAVVRFANDIERHRGIASKNEDYDEEHHITRAVAFDSAYLCLCTDDPMGTMYILWSLMKTMNEKKRESIGYGSDY